MSQLLRRLAEMPRTVQGAVLVAIAGGVFAAASMFPFGRALAVLVAGVALVGLLLLGYWQLLRYLKARRSSPMEQAIRGNAGAAPVGIAEPARRARLDDLRKNFEAGIQKFRDSGKNLYALPWYLLVGEPGSGKTEAIRHCNVGFPPGLQDQLQGAGGTLNMNWWFTNHAVILDTAGRLMFEEVEPGATGEWQEFLRLMRRGRPNCPVNGLMLVIPAESLVRDTAEAIEAKGGKIAQQLDNIQRALGVRFPVYVVVTKCDLVNGFREFFDGIADPGLQHQIMGWSNPAPLDTPFDPEQVDRHLAVVKQRLLRRRLGLLQDPVNTEDPRARRTDQVDALFEFPDAFMDLAPRLKRYLQMIFVAGEWSAMPLFLRGIYFSSSMREGEALDAKLADALGVSVESLPEGRVWDRDRSYFLRDLFMSKMFRERGLVTRAANVAGQQRRRRNLVSAASVLGLGLLAAFTYFGFTRLKEDIVEPAKFWSALGSEMQRPNVLFAPGRRAGPEADPDKTFGAWAFPLVTYIDTADAFGYRGDTEAELPSLAVPPEQRRRAALPALLQAQARRHISIPWVYYPVAVVTSDAGGDLASTERIDACRGVFEAGVLRPLADATRSQLRADANARRRPPWTDDATAAVRQLVRLEVQLTGAAVGAPHRKPIELAPLVQYLMIRAGEPVEKRQAAAKDAAALQETLKWLYTEQADSAWPPIEALSPATPDEVRAWGEMLVEHAAAPAEGGAGSIGRLVGSLRELAAAERSLQELGEGAEAQASAGKPAEPWLADWSARYAAVTSAGERAVALLPTLGARTLAQAAREAGDEARAHRAESIDDLLAELEPVPAEAGASGAADASGKAARLKALADLRTSLTTLKADLTAPPRDEGEQGDIAALDAGFVADGAWKRRAAMYEAADRLGAGETPAADDTPAKIAERLRRLEESVRAAAEKWSGASGPGPAAALSAGAGAVCRRAAQARAAIACHALVARFAAEFPTSQEGVRARVAGLATGDLAPPERPSLPLTSPAGRFAPEFSPKAGASVLRECFTVSRSILAPGFLATPDRQSLNGAVSRQSGAARDYLEAFCDYWTDGLTSEGGPLSVGAPDWAGFESGVSGVSERVRAPLEQAVDAIGQAAQAAGSLDPLIPSDDATARKAIERLRACAADSRASLKDRRRHSLEEMAARWASLGPDVWAARDALGRSLRQTGSADRFYEPPPDSDAYDVVVAYFNRLSVTGFKSLSADPAGRAADVLASLRPLYLFPLRAWAQGQEELTPEQVEEARTLLSRIRLPEPAGGASGESALGAGMVWPTEIAGPIGAMFGSGQLPEADLAMLRDMNARMDLVPAPGKPATVAVYYVDDPGRRVEGRSVKDRAAAIQLVGDGVRNGGVISRDGTRKLGEVPIASGPVAIELYSDPAGRQTLSRCNFPTRWLPLYILDRFPAMPQAQTPSVVEPQIRFRPDNDDEYGLILRLEFPGQMRLPSR